MTLGVTLAHLMASRTAPTGCGKMKIFFALSNFGHKISIFNNHGLIDDALCTRLVSALLQNFSTGRIK